MPKDNQTLLYELVTMFVKAYQPRYYVQYKGDIKDLISEFYLEFLTPKARERGKEQSLLDKFDPTITTLPYLVKVAVTRKLIDSSRTDKGEKNYTETYDDEYGDLSLDYISEHIDEPDFQIEEIEFDLDQVAELRDLYDEMSPERKKSFLRTYQEVKGVLSPNFKELFKDLVGN